MDSGTNGSFPMIARCWLYLALSTRSHARSSFLWLGLANCCHYDVIAAQFVPLNHSPANSYHGQALGISADGAVVVGYHYNPESEGFRWTSPTGLVGFGHPPGSIFSAATAVSGDGTVIVLATNTFDGIKGFRWTEAGGLVSLGDLPGPSDDIVPLGVSYDGSVIVGWKSGGREAFVWTETGGIVGIGDLPGAHFESVARGVSANGQVVVGYGTVPNSGNGDKIEAFRWTQDDGMVGLGTLPGVGSQSSAAATSDDGNIVVGWLTSSVGMEAFRWTEQTGLIGLGDLAGGAFQSAARAVSADGSVVVGSANMSDFGEDGEAYYWTATTGMQRIRDLLESRGVNMTGWNLSGASGVSANGTIVTGWGTGPTGNEMGWWADLSPVPEPVAIELIFSAGTLLCVRRASLIRCARCIA